MLASSLAFITLFALSSALHEDSLAEQLKYHLTEKGFESVHVAVKRGRVIVTSKNKTYQDSVEATGEFMSALLSGAREELSGRQKINVALIPQSRKIPVAAIDIPESEYLPLLNNKASGKESLHNIDASLDVGSAWEKTRGIRRAKSSLWKLDIVIHPQFKANFGDYNDPEIRPFGCHWILLPPQQQDILPGIAMGETWRSGNILRMEGSLLERMQDIPDSLHTSKVFGVIPTLITSLDRLAPDIASPGSI